MIAFLALSLLSPLPPEGLFELQPGALTPKVESWGPDCGPRPRPDARRAGRYRLEGGLLLPQGGAEPLLGRGACARLTGLPYAEERLAPGEVRCATPSSSAKKAAGRAWLSAADPNTLSLRHAVDFDWALKGSRCVVRFSGRLALKRVTPLVIADAGVAEAPAPARRPNPKPQPGVALDPELAAATPAADVATTATPSQAGAGLRGHADDEAPRARVPWGPLIGGLLLAALLLLLALSLRARRATRRRAAFHREALSHLDRADALAARSPAPRAAWPPPPMTPLMSPRPEALAPEATRPLASDDPPSVRSHGSAVHTCPECERSFDVATRFCPFDGAPLARGRVQGEAGPEDPLARRCPTCQRRWPAHVIYCPEDGAALSPRSRPKQTLICPSCGKRYPSGTQFCGHDGAKLVLLN
ncbi:zinc ribbon domain-containing protein [Myxococcota bacterium]|nr:zinc ribbon domain-containing protein [Myxococcota bacterium]